LRSFLIFLALVLLVYAAVNYYVYRRVMQGASIPGSWSWILKLALLALILSYPLGRALQELSPLERLFTWMGGFWLGAMYYGLLFAVLFDIIRFLDPVFGWLPNVLLFDRTQMGRIALTGASVIIIMLLTGGRVRAMFPVVREISLELPRLAPERGEYRVVFVSDFHLGVLVGERRLKRIVQEINTLNPDLILLGGDLIDERIDRMRWIIEPLKELQATDGIIAVTGNHEFYSGVEDFEKLMREAGIPVLRDSLTVVGEVLNLAGIDDITARGQYSKPQPPLKDVLASADANLPVILMHHTPQRISEAATAGVDLMLCGHTHGGQLWPASFLTNLVYRTPQGLSRFGSMYLYLSSGVGTWGPPVRVGASPEIVLLLLKPTEAALVEGGSEG